MAVVRVIKDFPEELEADLLEFFGVDLLDLWRGRLSIRRIGLLINSLLRKAGKSTLLMAMNDKTEWTEDTYLLARISDALETNNHLFVRANFEVPADQEIPEPTPITRPGEPEPTPTPVQPQMSSPQEIMDLFGHMNSL